MTGPHLLGFGKKQDNCAPSCGTQTNVYNYGLGIVLSGLWLLQNPMLGGYSATEAYLPSKKIAIAVFATYTPEAFDSQGSYKNASDTLFRSIGTYMAPDDPSPPVPISGSTQAARSVADPSVQSEIVAAVENDRKRYDMRSGLFEAYATPEFAQLNMKVPKNFDPKTLVAWAMKQKPYFPPGKGYRYSNTNYLLIGMIIEEITKDSVGNQIRKRLLEPFGLTQTSYPEAEAMPSQWVHVYHLDKQGDWEDISNTIPVAFMGSAGAMISDMNDIRRWIELYATGKTCGPGTYQDLINCIPFLGNTSFGLGITCSEGWYGYTGALPGYNTADYYSPATGTTILAWINYQAKEPVEGVASVMVRDIARIITPDHVPFVYKESSEPPKP